MDQLLLNAQDKIQFKGKWLKGYLMLKDNNFDLFVEVNYTYVAVIEHNCDWNKAIIQLNGSKTSYTVIYSL